MRVLTHTDGNDFVRELCVLASLRLSVLAQRRRLAPRDRTRCERRAGRTLVTGTEQTAFVSLDLEAGGVVRVKTPSGGYGPDAPSR